MRNKNPMTRMSGQSYSFYGNLGSQNQIGMPECTVAILMWTDLINSNKKQPDPTTFFIQNKIRPLGPHNMCFHMRD